MSNALATESSPYLRQHADNPVDWRPWGAAALAAARARDKPILLSIGYSACHWCHVMAHESFEDVATAQVMNDLYINIKVDREERPDLDKIYQLAHQALTRRGGGWPLTVFLAPDDLVPFYAGTYFPREARYGMPPFVYVLQQVRGFWDQRRDDVLAQTAALREFLGDYQDGTASSDALTDAPIRAALAQIEKNFDRRYGGHSGAPKFPHCAEMELLLELDASAMVELTLARIVEGGIHDQIGGGFCRYSVDERWEIPHFEKMLYDNAQLLPLLASASPAGSNRNAARTSLANESNDDADKIDTSLFAQGALRLVEWLAREMAAPGGAFYSALDADSEHAEGKFYVWQRDEVRAVLTDEDFAIVAPHYGFNRPANFEHEAWNPIIATSLVHVAQSLGIAVDEANRRLAHAREKLFLARSQRIRPGLDDKILTAWNALLISGLARAARAHALPALTVLAEKALDFLHENLWRDNRLSACFAGGAAKLPAYLDDHAFLLDALIETLQCRWSDRDLAWAIRLADALLERFEDRERGGFYFTAHDHEPLPQRPKPWIDDATPCGNGVAARALLRLGHLLGEIRYLAAAERALRAAYSTMQQMSQACASMLRALNDFLHPRTHVVIRYHDSGEERAWRQAPDTAQHVDAYFIPQRATVASEILAAQKYVPGGVAYFCRGAQCEAPMHEPAALAQALDARVTKA